MIKTYTYDSPEAREKDFLSYPTGSFMPGDAVTTNPTDRTGRKNFWAVRGLIIGAWKDPDTVGFRGPHHMTVLWNGGKAPVFGNTITGSLSNMLINIQPMTCPTGNLFYMDYVYGTGSLGV